MRAKRAVALFPSLATPIRGKSYFFPCDQTHIHLQPIQHASFHQPNKTQPADSLLSPSLTFALTHISIVFVYISVRLGLCCRALYIQSQNFAQIEQPQSLQCLTKAHHLNETFAAVPTSKPAFWLFSFPAVNELDGQF